MASVLGWLRTGCRLDGVDVMGMSPSCHCICPGTGSANSSRYGHRLCSSCVDGAPYQYLLQVSGVTGRCSALYNGSFLLNYRSACRWTTDEVGVNLTIVSGVCEPSVSPRYGLIIGGACKIPPGFCFQINPGITGTLCFGSDWYSTPNSSVNQFECFASRTLTGDGATYSRNSTCLADLHVFPTSVTITAV